MPALKRKQIDINLLPSDEGGTGLGNRVIRWLLGTFRFLVIVVELIVILGFLSRFFLDTRNSDLTDDINQKKALIESYLPFEKDFKRAQKRIEILNTYAYADTPLSQYISQLTKNISSDMQITQLTKNGDEITMDIVSRSEQAIVTYVQRTQKETLLTNLSVVSVEGVSNSSLIRANVRSGPIEE